jgi:lipopolysaccharide/colanic/teichoic acid biosynthesis glycosyltransferase
MKAFLPAKRVFDIAAALILALALGPAMTLIAVAVKLDSRGSVLFRQKRLGHHGRPFWILKFRTMIPSAQDQRSETYENDPRITRVGRVLRKYRLDEIPQLFNVIAGDMSLVGPRPLLPEFLTAYTERERKRLDMPQGMTGWQQIVGGATSTWDERIRLDLWYVEHWSPWLDALILLKTPFVVLKADTVYDRDGRQKSGIPTRSLSERTRERSP